MSSSVTSSQRIFGAAAVLIGAAALLYHLKRTKNPSVVRVVEMHIFPVKSCAGMAVTSARLLPTGFEYDREWVIIRKSDSKVMTMRECSSLKKLVASVDTSLQLLVLRFPGKAEISVPLGWAAEAGAEEQLVSLWDISGTVKPFGDAAVHQWLTELINENLSSGACDSYFLARIGSTLRNPGLGPDRPIVPEEQRIAFQNCTSVHVTSVPSLEALRTSVGDPSINSLRFRPNIVVDGGDPYDEDTWDEFSVGTVPMKTAKLCDRCTIPTINDDANRNKDFLPTSFLRRERLVHFTHLPKSEPPQGMFGIAVFQRRPLDDTAAPVIHVGDYVIVSMRRQTPKFVKRENTTP
jgi:uncharacterized protein YcbX